MFTSTHLSTTSIRKPTASGRAIRSCPPIQSGRHLGLRRLDDELEQICPALWKSILAGRSIELSVTCEPIVMQAPRVWHACLLLSELLRTAVSNGFGSRAEGVIAMEIRSLTGHVVCVLSDNSGSAEGAGVGRSTELVDEIAAGLAANVHREQGPVGVIVLLTFPIDEVPAPTLSRTKRPSSRPN